MSWKQIGRSIAALLTLALCLSAGSARGALYPADGARINWTQVLFEIDPLPEAAGYLIQVGDAAAADPFARPHLELRTRSLTARADRFQFGHSYRWRYAALDAAGRPGEFTESAGFTILTSPLVDRERFRVRTRGPETIPGIQFLDHARVAIDGTGRPLWFLPDLPGLIQERDLVNDLKISPAGTVTLLTLSDALEIDPDGALRWQAPRIAAPQPGTRGTYHHDFKRLPDGHYMLLFFEPISRLVPGEQEPRDLHYDGLIQYDADGKVIWSWRARDHIADVDAFSGHGGFMHANAFEIDPTGRFVLLGFRDLSRIVKIDRQSGEIVDSWGARFPSGEARSGEGFFWNQHDCNLAADGTIVVFNNNRVTDEAAPSGIVRFDPGAPGKSPRVVWRWDVPASEGAARKARAGGNVSLLPGDEGYLLNMGAVNHLFLVAPDGRVRWEGLVENRIPMVEGMTSKEEDALRALGYLEGGEWSAGTVGEMTPGKWLPFPQYRVSWASSLWPIWFTVEEHPRRDEASPRSVRVFNEGSEPDAYLVSDADGREKRTGLVPAGTWVDLELGRNPGSVTVRSVADPARVRSITVRESAAAQ